MNRAARAVLVALLAISPQPARSQIPPGPIALRFLPQARPITYRARETTVRVELVAGQDARTRKTELARTLYRQVRPGLAGNLALTQETLAFAESVDGQPLASRAASLPTTSAMSPRGLVRLRSGAFGLPTPLTLLLPAAPLPSALTLFGQKRLEPTTWTTESGPSTDVPLRVRTVHRIAGVAVAQGRECVVVELAARESGTLDGGTRLFEYFARRTVLFDPVAGLIVDSKSEERADDAVLPPPKHGLLRKHWEILGTSRLQSPDRDPALPRPPGQ